MASLTRNILAGILGSLLPLHPRETQLVNGVLASAGAEVVTDSDGCGTVTLDLRGTFNQVVEVAGTIDGVNWSLIPMKPVAQTAKLYLSLISGSTQGLWIGACAGFRKVRARVTTYTSGSAEATLAANLGLPDTSLDGMICTTVTATGAAGAGVTLTIPSAGAGLRHYITYLSINRIAAAALTAAAVPVVVTTTNMPGTLAFSMPADAAAQGTAFPLREDFAFPIMTNALATATTFVAPGTTGVIWRLTAGYFNAP